jgi:hypothetical protein
MDAFAQDLPRTQKYMPRAWAGTHWFVICVEVGALDDRGACVQCQRTCRRTRNVEEAVKMYNAVVARCGSFDIHVTLQASGRRFGLVEKLRKCGLPVPIFADENRTQFYPREMEWADSAPYNTLISG